MNDLEIIWTLLGIGYLFGFCLIAYFGITGTNEAIDFAYHQSITDISSANSFNQTNIILPS